MKKIITILSCIALILTGCNSSDTASSPQKNYNYTKTATFAGGCFWCVEAAFEKYEGISDVISGFAGGSTKSPTYEQVASGATQYVEAVQFTYDPSIITYNDLLEIFWRQIDPTDAEGSFVDRGFQYTSAIFYHTDEQKKLAEASRKKMASKYDKPIATRIVPANTFVKAEEYHQNYHTENPLRYKYYRSRSGRDQYREEVWGDDKDYILPTDLRARLTPLQYYVTQENGTEPAFKNEYWDNKEQGIYVDIISGEPLFSSRDKFKSGTGWPSFTQPLERDNLILKEDNTLFMRRTEVRSKKGDAHLGHVFNDGPVEKGGLRYCINSAALKFIPKENMSQEGYEKYINHL